MVERIAKASKVPVINTTQSTDTGKLKGRVPNKASVLDSDGMLYFRACSWHLDILHR